MKTTAGIAAGKDAVLKHLEMLASLSDADRDLLIIALGAPVQLCAGQQVVPQNALLDNPVFILSGWVCRAVTLADGRRQILDFYVPGDLVGFSTNPNARAEATYLCLTDVVTSSAREMIARVRRESGHYTALAAALASIEREIERNLLDQIVRLGRMQAVERMVDLMADLYVRLHRAGRANGFLMPLTQDILGDALGLSTVHINRALQQLKLTHLIKTRAKRIEVQNPTSLVERARALRSGRSTSRA